MYKYEGKKILNGQILNDRWTSSFTDSWADDTSSNVMSVTLTDAQTGESSNVQFPIEDLFEVNTSDDFTPDITGLALRYNVATANLASAPTVTFYYYTVGGTATSVSTTASGTGTASGSDYDAIYTIADDDVFEIDEDMGVNVKIAFETGNGSVVKVYSAEVMYEEVT